MKKNVYLKCFLFLSTIFLFQSCIIVNCTGREYDKVCNVHHKKMKRTMVGTSFGLRAYDADPLFPNCKEKQNMGCVVKPWPINRLAIMYHCTVCDSAMAYSNKLN